MKESRNACSSSSSCVGKAIQWLPKRRLPQFGLKAKQANMQCSFMQQCLQQQQQNQQHSNTAGFASTTSTALTQARTGQSY
jgi:hypothetical protein